MSSISPVGSQPVAVSGIEPTSGMSPPPAPYLMGTLGGVAGMLSMSTPDLRSALGSGSSIADLAASKGVSLESIVQYVEQTVQQQRSAQGKPPVGSQVLDDVVNRAVNRHRGRRHPAGPVQPATTTGRTSTAGTQGSGPASSSFLDLLA